MSRDGSAGAAPTASSAESVPNDGAALARLTARQAAVFRPVRTGNAFEETVARLLQAIKLGLVEPGRQLPPERELSSRLAISRVTLREAIRALQQAGYLDVRRGRYGGTFVRRDVPPVDQAPLRDLVDDLGEGFEDALVFRGVVEVGAAVAAASRSLSEQECGHLAAALRECESSELATYRRCDSRLHLAIAEVTGSVTLVAALADARMRLNALLDAIPLLPRNITHSNAQHATIVAAIIAADPERARAAMTEHVDGTALLLRGFLR